MQVHSVGIDIGKTVFHLVALDAQGSVVIKKQFSRTQLVRFTANLKAQVIGMEACSGAHYLARALQAQGHKVRLMPAEYVKPYVKSNKNDFLDAEAIAEAVTRPSMRFVAVKTDAQLDMQAMHRVRDRWIGRRTSLINQIRGFLLERGITIRKGAEYLRKNLPTILEDGDNPLTPRSRQLLDELRQELQLLDGKLQQVTQAIAELARRDEACRRLDMIPGIGPIISTALTAAIGNGSSFRKGRDLAAWMGLVPRQYSSGGKPTLLGISKRGNGYLRKMFIEGARGVLARLRRNQHAFGAWMERLEKRKPSNVVVVAVANKLVRIAWAVLTTGQPYQALA